MADSQRGAGEAGDRNEQNVPDLRENCVEYSIFLVDPNASSDPLKQLSQLDDLRKTALQLANSLTADYIWQKGLFTLDVVTEQGSSSPPEWFIF